MKKINIKITISCNLKDYTVLDAMKEEPIRVQIRGSRKTFFPPLIHPPSDDSPPDKRLTLNWVYPFKQLLSEIIQIK